MNSVEKQLMIDFDIPVDNVFTIWFDSHFAEWRPMYNYNFANIRILMAHLEDLLYIRGYITLADIYNELGVPVDRRLACETIVGSTNKFEYNLSDNVEDPNIRIDIHLEGIIIYKLLKEKGVYLDEE